MSLEVRMKMTSEKVKALEQLLRTFDRFGLMPPYLVTVNIKPSAAYVSDTSLIKNMPYKRSFGVVIRIIGDLIYRIEVDDE